MGYTTEFRNSWTLNKPLDDATFNFLTRLNNTRRMKRNLIPLYGIEGEFFTDGKGILGQETDPSVIDGNEPPRTQPSLWCHWTPTEDRLHIEWDGGEKFYGYIEWIKYIISKVLAPRGYVLNGDVDYRGEDFDDQGTIEIIDNVVDGKTLDIDYSINKLLCEVESSPQTPAAGLKGDPIGQANILHAKSKTSSKTKAWLEIEITRLTSINNLLEEKLQKKEETIKTLESQLRAIVHVLQDKIGSLGRLLSQTVETLRKLSE